MAKRFNPFMLIPIALNVMVLAVIPTFAGTDGYPRAVLVSLIAIAWPWILYFAIGRIIDGVVQNAGRAAREQNENHDFV